MFSRRILMSATLASTVLAATGALGQASPIVGIATTTTYNVDGRITAVDPNANTVTLILADGVVTTRKVGPCGGQPRHDKSG